MGTRRGASRQACETALRVSANYFIHLFHSLLPRLQKLYKSSKDLFQSLYHKLLKTVGPEHDGKPSGHTVVWTLFAFMFFLVFASLAVKFPTCKLKIAFVSVNTVIVSALSILVWLDFRGSKMIRGRSSKMFRLAHNFRSEQIQKEFGELYTYRSLHNDPVDSGILTRLVSRSQLRHSAGTGRCPGMYYRCVSG